MNSILLGLINWIIDSYGIVIKGIVTIIPIVISIMALQRTGGKVEIVSDSQPEWIRMLLLDSGQSIVNSEYGQLHLNFQAVNTFNQDMGFFDLAIIDVDTGEELSFNTKAQLTPFNGIDASKATSFQTFDGEVLTASIPDGYAGVFKAHGLTSLDLFIHTERKTKRIEFTIKLAKKKFNWRYIWTKEQRNNFRYHMKQLSGIRNVPVFPSDKYAELEKVQNEIKAQRDSSN